MPSSIDWLARAPKHLHILCDRRGFADLNAKLLVFSGRWTTGPRKRDGDTSTNEIPLRTPDRSRLTDLTTLRVPSSILELVRKSARKTDIRLVTPVTCGGLA